MLPLTVDMLRAAYDYLCTTPPFAKWNLPDGEDVKFRVGKTANLCAWVEKISRKPHYTIVISQAKTSQTVSLMQHMAHEMIHVHLYMVGAETGGEHNAAFRKLAVQVCKYHGFDLRLFY